MLLLAQAETLRVGDLDAFLALKKKRPSNALSNAHLDRKQGRHVKWDTCNYTLLRKGVPFDNMTQIDQLFGRNAVEESNFFIFKRLDSNVARNDSIPVYEAAYLCDSFYVRVQKKHLAQAYRKCGRSKKEHMWSVDEETGLPYWVDRYCFSMLGQRASKKRYEAKKRRK